MYGSRRTLGFPPRTNHLATGGPSRRPPTAGCADQRSAFPCLRVAPPGEKSGRTVSAIPMYGSHRTLGFPPRTNHLPSRARLRRAVRPEVERLPARRSEVGVRNPDERCLPFQCTDHAERWDFRRERTTSQLGVLPAARLRRAVPTRGRRSLACASLRLVAWAPCASSASAWPPSATRRALPCLVAPRNPDERCLPFQCTDHAERWDSRREGTTSQLGVLPAARLRRAVPTGGRRSLACASLRLVAWAPCASSASATNGVCHSNVRITPNAGIPAEKEPPRSFPGPSRRPPRGGGAGPHRENWPEVGVPRWGLPWRVAPPGGLGAMRRPRNTTISFRWRRSCS